MASSRMEASAISHAGLEVVHIHNYSMNALKSLCCEIKKFPIIYKDHRHISFAPQLIDLSWTRIISAILDCDGNFSPVQRGYWDLSFRELWKWMRLMLVRDMKQRALNPFCIRKPGFNWLDYLKFVEKYINLDDESAEGQQWNPYIQVKILTADTVITETEKYTVIWLRDSREETNNENEGISIRFQSKDYACNVTATTKQPTSTSPVSTSDSNDSKIDESRILVPSAGFFTNATKSSPTSSSQGSPVQTPNGVPQEQSGEIDEDFQFTMSLLPKLKELEPRMNMDVKMQILQALHDAI